MVALWLRSNSTNNWVSSVNYMVRFKVGLKIYHFAMFNTLQYVTLSEYITSKHLKSSGSSTFQAHWTHVYLCLTLKDIPYVYIQKCSDRMWPAMIETDIWEKGQQIWCASLKLEQLHVSRPPKFKSHRQYVIYKILDSRTIPRVIIVDVNTATTNGLALQRQL